MVNQAKAYVRPRNDRSRNVSSVEGGWEIDGLVTDSDTNMGGFIRTLSCVILLLDVVDGLGHFLDHLARQGNVAHLIAHFLPFGEAVLYHITKRLRHLGIAVLLVEYQPGVGDDGIGSITVRVRQPGAKIGRELHASQGRLS